MCGGEGMRGGRVFSGSRNVFFAYFIYFCLRNIECECLKYFKVFRMFKGSYDIYAEDYLFVDQSNITRRHNSFKIIGKRFSSNEAKHFFSHVVNVCNSLSSNVVDNITLTTSKT